MIISESSSRTAWPKSAILKSKFSVTRMLDGFKSQWTILDWWMSCRPDATCLIIFFSINSLKAPWCQEHLKVLLDESQSRSEPLAQNSVTAYLVLMYS